MIPPPYSHDRRYRLHQKIKKRFSYSATARTVLVPPDYADNDPDVAELRDIFKYNIQFTIDIDMNFTPAQIEEVKNVLGHRYSKKVVVFLNEKGIMNAEGNEYSPDSIRGIVNGSNNRTAPPEVIAAILELVENTRKTVSKIDKSIKKTLKAS